MTPEMLRHAKHLVTHSEHFSEDCNHFFCQLSDNFDWFKTLDIFRQVAVLALAYALGWKNFIALSEIIFYLSRNNYDQAAIEIAQKGYEYIANVIKTGEIKFAETK